MTNTQFPLPPDTTPFEAILETGGRLQLNDVPDDEKVLNQIVQALVQTQPFGAAWESEYRTLYLLSGAATEPVTTLEQVQAIAVPGWRRLRGELVGGELKLSEQLVSADGETWTAYPTFSGLDEENKHPAFVLPGETLGRFVTLHWREGRIDIEPDPPEDLLELFESVVQMFNGADDDAWKTRHEQFGGDSNTPVAAKRASIELRGLAPLFSPSEPPLVRQFGTEFWPLTPLEYSKDGKKWAAYTVAGVPTPVLDSETEGEDGQDPFGLLSQLFDLQSVSVTVDAAGQVGWDEGAIPAEHADALRQSILSATGAGQAELWAERTAELLPAGVTGTAQAIRLQVMKALLDNAPGMLDQSFAPSAVSIDGENWHELAADFLLDDEIGGEEGELT